MLKMTDASNDIPYNLRVGQTNTDLYIDFSHIIN